MRLWDATYYMRHWKPLFLYKYHAVHPLFLSVSIKIKDTGCCSVWMYAMYSLTPASIGSVVPVSRSTLSAVGSVDSGLTGTLTVLRVTRLDESRRGIAVALTTAGARVEAKRAILTNKSATDSCMRFSCSWTYFQWRRQPPFKESGFIYISFITDCSLLAATFWFGLSVR